MALYPVSLIEKVAAVAAAAVGSDGVVTVIITSVSQQSALVHIYSQGVDTIN